LAHSDPQSGRVPVRRALLSVSDKSGLLPLAQALAARGVELVSTGGTARALVAAGLPVTEVASYTGFPEIMDGRVKTLHPRVHGALLGRAGTDDRVMAEHGIRAIDLLVVNLYPFAATVARPGCSDAEAIEDIDVGGPAMLRAAAKNHARVAVLVEPADYPGLTAALERGGTTLSERRALAQKAYVHTARYDAAIAAWLAGSDSGAAFPAALTLEFAKRGDLRYGENPHQAAAFYADPLAGGASIANAAQLQGKELSYNNVADGDTALECVRQWPDPACVIVKHANPCGAAVAGNATDAYLAAYRTDPSAAFGGIIAFNRPLDAATAETILERQFVEVLIAPGASVEARARVAAKPGVRLMLTGPLADAAPPAREYRSVRGGLLVQTPDSALAGREAYRVVTRRAPTSGELDDLEFAWRVCKFVKSNAIVVAREQATVGIGAGQMSRVTSVRIAAMKAAEASLSLTGTALASDAFFPFRDGLDAAAGQGVRAVIQPGGSVKDAEIIAAADEHGLAMVFTGERHFRH
jgi:phosphoribosylaminoimidazolecarboxamide formyltransferase / IMP cyclohydrolase